ncbi:MAG: ankyrin repeat domain-containing protein, partial [Roseibacillus sp.]|nr:ankyrin repeat domain-containing protein [Roseibacillus sp.]
KEIVELLIAKGADVNAKFEDDGSTPLHLAAWKGHFETAELLIAKGADVNAKDKDGETPLNWAIKNKHTETADLLRKHGGKTGEELKAEGK